MRVKRFNDRMMKVNIVIGDVLGEVISCYCPQAGRSINEKEGFYELIDSFGEVYGGFGIGEINDGGIRLLDWAVGKGLYLMNTCFWKRKSQHITFRSGETETMIDYTLVNNKYRSSVRDVKVIPGEEVVSQHCLLLMDMVFKKMVRRKIKFRKKLKLRLRESEVKEEFAKGVNNNHDGNEDWCGLKRKLLDVDSEFCGYTKGKPGHFEMWWWNKNVDVVLCRKRK